MTWLEALRNAIRTFLITRETENVVTDVVNNGLTPADVTIIDTFLAQTMP
ncbi:MAG TPA: hypothetical protein VIG24_12955 [Acidimicrobiia bacterium]